MISPTPQIYHRVITAILTFFAAAAIGNSAIILDTNFDNLAVGVVNEAGLDAETTGGNWTINTGRDSNLTTVQDDGGNRALLFDDDNGENGGDIWFTRLDLDSAIDVSGSSSSLIFDFTTATRRTGANKGLRYSFNSAAGDEAAYIDWIDIDGFNSPTAELHLNGTQIGNLAFRFLSPWDSADPAVTNASIVFSNGAVSIDFGGITSVPVPLLNGVTAISQFEILSTGSSSQSRGVYLDNVQASLVPEPSSICLMAFMMAALVAFYRNGKKDTRVS